MKEANIKFEEVSKRYDNKSPAVSKLALFVLPPLAALVLWLLFFNTGKFYFDHFILATELSSIFIGLHFLFIPLLALIALLINIRWESYFWDGNAWLELTMLAIDMLIISIAFKRVYGQKWYWVIPKAFVFFYVFGQGVLYLYQVLVLVVTLKLC